MLFAANEDVEAPDVAVPDAFGVAAVVMGLAVFAVVRRGVLPAGRLLDLGLVFLVLGVHGIAVPEFWGGLPRVPGISLSIPAECVWIVAYPLLVPNTPQKILILNRQNQAKTTGSVKEAD